VGTDADGDDGLAGLSDGGAQGGGEGRLVADVVVGRQHREHGVGAGPAGDHDGAQPHGGGGVAGGRLGHQVLGRQLGEDLPQRLDLIGGGHHQDVLAAEDRLGAAEGGA
jgi:hypothetical protein